MWRAKNRAVAVREVSWDVLTDDQFWQELRRDAVPYIVAIFTDLFMAGVLASGDDVAKATRAEFTPIDTTPWELIGLPPEQIEAIAQEHIASYTNRWWEQFEAGTKRRLRDILLQSNEEGLTPRAVAAIIAPEFGKERALAIAVTEMTNLMGAGAQTRYKLAGFGEWQHRTANDRRVCPICAPLEDETFPIAVPFSALHPGCRCWLVPAGGPVAPKALPDDDRIPPEGAQRAIKAYTAKGGMSASKYQASQADYDELDRWLEKGVVPEPVARGIGFSDARWGKEYEQWSTPGSEVAFRPRTSYSLRDDRAMGYSAGDVAVKLRVVGGMKGRKISEYSLYPEEAEALAPPGQRLRILSADRGPGGIWHIDAEDISVHPGA